MSALCIKECLSGIGKIANAAKQRLPPRLFLATICKHLGMMHFESFFKVIYPAVIFTSKSFRKEMKLNDHLSSH